MHAPSQDCCCHRCCCTAAGHTKAVVASVTIAVASAVEASAVAASVVAAAAAAAWVGLALQPRHAAPPAAVDTHQGAWGRGAGAWHQHAQQLLLPRET